MKLAGTGPIKYDRHGAARVLLVDAGISYCTLRWNGECWRKGEDFAQELFDIKSLTEALKAMYPPSAISQWVCVKPL